MMFLGLGSNLGDRKRNFEQAFTLLTEGGNAPLVIDRVSSVYESAALLPDGAPKEWNIPYYNIVLSASSKVEPEETLAWVKAVEQQMGRKDIGRWGPRIIDIDILSFNNKAYQLDGLVLPHPEMLKRDFVMVPLAEIAPDWRHPNGKTARQWVDENKMAEGLDLKRTDVVLQWR